MNNLVCDTALHLRILVHRHAFSVKKSNEFWFDTCNFGNFFSTILLRQSLSGSGPWNLAFSLLPNIRHHQQQTISVSFFLPLCFLLPLYSLSPFNFFSRVTRFRASKRGKKEKKTQKTNRSPSRPTGFKRNSLICGAETGRMGPWGWFLLVWKFGRK